MARVFFERYLINALGMKKSADYSNWSLNMATLVKQAPSWAPARYQKLKDNERYLFVVVPI